MMTETTIASMIKALTKLFKKFECISCETIAGYIKLTFSNKKNKAGYKIVVLNKLTMSKKLYYTVNRVLNISCFDNIDVLNGEII